MEGLSFSNSRQIGISEIRPATPSATPSRQAQTGTDETAESAQPPADKNPQPVKSAPVVESQSSYQARLNYDREKATVFVEILDPTTGDVLQRMPAESAADRIHELTGGYGGSMFDKLA